MAEILFRQYPRKEELIWEKTPPKDNAPGACATIWIKCKYSRVCNRIPDVLEFVFTKVFRRKAG